jgi:hypothetical protein
MHEKDDIIHNLRSASVLPRTLGVLASLNGIPDAVE